MNQVKSITRILFLSTLFYSIVSISLFGQMEKSKDQNAEKIIGKMTKAHGGLDKWENAASISFKAHLEFLFGNMPEYFETVTVHPLSREAYVDFLEEGGEKRAEIAFDGKTAWAKGVRKGIENAPPRFTAWRNFYLFNLPWVVHDEGVNISTTKMTDVPDDLQKHLQVKMTFGEDIGDTPKDFYVLFINPETFLLDAATYNMTYASMLPPNSNSLPTSLLRFKSYTEKNGMKLLSAYEVYFKDSGQHIINGKVWDWSLSRPFDKSRLMMPEGAELDQSSPRMRVDQE